jgi:hypothetical protein
MTRVTRHWMTPAMAMMVVVATTQHQRMGSDHDMRSHTSLVACVMTARLQLHRHHHCKQQVGNVRKFTEVCSPQLEPHSIVSLCCSTDISSASAATSSVQSWAGGSSCLQRKRRENRL